MKRITDEQHKQNIAQAIEFRVPVSVIVTDRAYRVVHVVGQDKADRYFVETHDLADDASSEMIHSEAIEITADTGVFEVDSLAGALDFVKPHLPQLS